MADQVAQSISNDNRRWNDDISSIEPSSWVCMFEATTLMKPTWRKPKGSKKIRWVFSPVGALVIYNKMSNKFHRFLLRLQLCQEVAFLEHEYWATLASGDKPLSSYLEMVRDDLLEELWSMQPSPSPPQQLSSTRPWAIRTNHGFGHSESGRAAYLTKCREHGWKEYMHDESQDYRM